MYAEMAEVKASVVGADISNGISSRMPSYFMSPTTPIISMSGVGGTLPCHMGDRSDQSPKYVGELLFMIATFAPFKSCGDTEVGPRRNRDLSILKYPV